MKKACNILFTVVALICLMVVACGKEDIEVPTSNKIETNEITDIYDYTAKCTYTVEIDESYLLERGVCWSTETKPTIDNSKAVDINKSGKRTITLTGLKDNTTYYVRAYATTVTGTFYAKELTFSVKQHTLPTVTTNDVSSITINTAVCGGNVTYDGGLTVTARGVCWSTSPNPTIDNSKTTNGSGTGIFTSNITGLTENVTYYVRAYATNAKGTAYGEEKSFTTLPALLPTVTTNDVSSITATTVVCGGNVTDAGNLTVTARGVCWSTSPNPTINNSKTTNGNGLGTFTSDITGLTEGVTYYVRAYATNSKGTAYGEERSFTTLHNWVDLGLPSGLKWATCNVGAATPEEYGNYYAWGETTTKTSYTQSNSLTYGQQMSDISGNATYDAARANWGSTWRMPTKEEMGELINNCTWTWTTQSGVKGYSVTGPNGNSIFLPAAGSEGHSVVQRGYYWSSTPYESDDFEACSLGFGSGFHDVFWNFRYYGHTVRPVSE